MARANAQSDPLARSLFSRTFMSEFGPGDFYSQPSKARIRGSAPRRARRARAAAPRAARAAAAAAPPARPDRPLRQLRREPAASRVSASAWARFARIRATSEPLSHLIEY